MIKKIHLENFMAHQATSIELSPGVTVITGPNNIGKSAIVEAIRYLVYNPAPKNVIRHGAKKAVVRLELDSGESITWQRQDKHASYLIEQYGRGPEEYYKFGREVPDDVRSLLRLEQVETDTEDKIDIHLGNQRTPIFLLDRPGSHAAGFFAASTEADYLLKMQQALKRRISLAKDTKKRLDLELVALAQQISQYDPLDEIEARLSQAESLFTLIQAANQQLPLLAASITQMEAAFQQLRQARRGCEVLGGLENPPVWDDTTGLTWLAAELADKISLHGRESTRRTMLAGLTSPPPTVATADLDAMLGTYREYLVHQDHIGARQHVLAELAAPPATVATRELAELICALASNAGRADTARQRFEAIVPMPEPPVLAATKGLPELIQNLAEHIDKTAAAKHHLAGLEQLAGPPELFDLSPLADLVQDMTRQHDLYNLQRQATHLLLELLPPPAGEAILPLEEAIQALTQGMSDLSQYQARLAGLHRQVDQKKVEIQGYLNAAGVCPLCGNSLTLEHFLDNEHA